MELVDAPPRTRDVRDTQPLPHPRDGGGRTACSSFAAIDNLWKGAAGQAVQDLNLMLGLPRPRASRDGLLPLALGGAARRT